MPDRKRDSASDSKLPHRTYFMMAACSSTAIALAAEDAAATVRQPPEAATALRVAYSCTDLATRITSSSCSVLTTRAMLSPALSPVVTCATKEMR